MINRVVESIVHLSWTNTLLVGSMTVRDETINVLSLISIKNRDVRKGRHFFNLNGSVCTQRC